MSADMQERAAPVVWRPQPRQLEFMSRPEPEALYGGAAAAQPFAPQTPRKDETTYRNACNLFKIDLRAAARPFVAICTGFRYTIIQLK